MATTQRSGRPSLNAGFIPALVLCTMVTICVVLLPVTSRAEASTPAPLRIGFFSLPPHAYVTSEGEITGAAVELLTHHIAPLMGVSVEIVGPIPLQRLLNDFSIRRLDGILLLSYTPERAKLFRFPSIPFWQTFPSLALPTASPITPNSLRNHLGDLTIGYVHNAWVPDLLRNSAARLDPAAGEYATDRNLMKLITKRVDAVFAPDSCAMICSVNRVRVRGKTKIIRLPVPPLPVYTVFRKDIPDTVVTAYESALSQLNTPILYSRLKKPHMTGEITPRIDPLGAPHL